jgi:hypothetical protein
MGALFRLIWFLWILGFVGLAFAATSQLLFARAENPVGRWINQLAAAALWPVAMFSQAGRDALRARFRL